MIELNKVGFQYSGNDPLIREISFTLERGGILGLLGHNGSGKSTLMKLIGGLLRPKSGTIRIMDTPLDALSRKTLYKSMSMMIEEPSLYGHLSVWDNLRIRSLYHQVDLNKITPVLQQVGMYEFRDRRTAKLSTGMKQRVGLAAALLSDPEILLLDEPTASLDVTARAALVRRLADLKAGGTAMIGVFHHPGDVAQLIDTELDLTPDDQHQEDPDHVAV